MGSTAAMTHTARTSPFHDAWIASVPADLAAARAAIAARDLPALGAVAERSALRMHASAMAADPAIIYWNPATLAAIARVRALRDARHAGLLHHRRRPARQGALPRRRRRRRRRRAARRPRRQRRLIAAPGPGARVVEAPGR